MVPYYSAASPQLQDFSTAATWKPPWSQQGKGQLLPLDPLRWTDWNLHRVMIREPISQYLSEVFSQHRCKPSLSSMVVCTAKRWKVINSIQVLLPQGMFHSAKAKQNRLSYSLQSYGMHFIWWLFWQWHKIPAIKVHPLCWKLNTLLHVMLPVSLHSTGRNSMGLLDRTRTQEKPSTLLSQQKVLAWSKRRKKGFPGSPFIIWDLTDLLPNSL